MITPRQLLRIARINYVLVRHGLDEIILATHLFRPLRFLFYMAPWNWFRGQRAPHGERIRLALEELGPIFVKFGQMISTRRDLLPAEVAGELARLQDRVPPFPAAQARATIERALGKPVAEAFVDFDDEALASASIAQVHAATLASGDKVVVKVLRPGVEEQVRRDIDLMKLVARLAERYWRDGRRLRVQAVVGEFEKTLYDELDLLREAANAAQLKRNWQHSDMLYVPAVHWPLCRRDVMVMERIGGIQINDIAGLRASGADLKKLSENGVEIFFTQVFAHNFFHADMHPGNIFVDVSDPASPKYIAVDFGIVGTLNPEDQDYLARNFLAFFNRDYRRVAELHVESGWVPAGTRVDEFESAIRTVCEPIFNRPLKDISFGQLLIRLFQTARRFDMEVQPQLVLLQKTLIYVEGLGRELYPDLDLWTTAKPYLERWMREQVGPREFLRHLRAHFPETARALADFPLLVKRVLESIDSGERDARHARRFDALRAEIARGNARRVRAIAGAGLVVAAAVPLALGAGGWLMWAAAAAGVAGVGLLVHAIR